jgi:hypothetical protein
VRTRTLAILSLLGALAAATSAGGERLFLQSPAASGGRLSVGVMKPFDVFMVAERDSGKTQLSQVDYRLQVPEGVLLAGEELFVESIVALGSSRTGMMLVFHCADNPQLQVMRFRLIATKPIAGAVLALRPEERTHFLGVVACRDETFAKFDCAPDSLVLDAR